MAPAGKAKAKASAPDSGGLSFEASLERLEAVVKSLEAGDIELETALAHFEEGVTLMRACSAQLEAAERRIEVLVAEADGLVAQPFEADEDEDFEAEADEEAG
jgi:exodeoxyribonuclease VII small subunit